MMFHRVKYGMFVGGENSVRLFYKWGACSGSRYSVLTVLLYALYANAVCHSINQWPYPRPGHVIHLPLMGELIYIRIPSKADKPSAAKILANSPAVKSAVSLVMY